MRKKTKGNNDNKFVAYMKAGVKAALPTIIGLIPVVGPVAEDAVEKVIEAIDKKGEELKKENQEEFKKLMNELNEIRKSGKKTQEMAERQAEILSLIAGKVGIKEEELCSMIKKETINEMKQISSYPIFPVYAAGFIVWAEDNVLSEEAQETLWEIFSEADDKDEYFEEDSEANEVVNRIKAYIVENIDMENDGCSVSDSFIVFSFDWEKDGYEGYPYNSDAINGIISFINDLNKLIDYIGGASQPPFYMSYQIYW